MEIEKGHDFPEDKVRRGAHVKYPFADMDAGDSFFLPDKKHEDISGVMQYWNKKLAPRVFKACLYDSAGNREGKIIDGKPVEGIRVHRIT